MKIQDYKDSPSHKINSETVKGVEERVVIGKEDKAENFCMRVFTVEPGGFTPRHSHDWEHEVFVHSGRGQVYKEGEWHFIEAGTAVFVPANEEHQFMNAGAEDFVFICLVPANVYD